MMSREALSWLSGEIDGEGTLGRLLRYVRGREHSARSLLEPIYFHTSSVKVTIKLRASLLLVC